jgi:hypothetical protein
VGTGEILYFSGPFKGAAAGITIATKTILYQLQPEERMWGDKAYINDIKVITPTRGSWKYMHPMVRLKNKKIYRARQIVERSILRLKHFGCVTKRWPYSLKLHQKVISALVKLMNFNLCTHPLN